MTARKKKKAARTVSEDLQDIGMVVYKAILDGKYPSLDVPSRTKSNIIYDEKTEQWILGGKTAKRDAGTVDGAKPLAQLMWLIRFAQNSIMTGKTHTKRTTYYAAYNEPVTSYTKQAESDALIEELEVILGRPREDFGITPGQSALIYGDIDVEFENEKSGKRTSLNLTTIPDGVSIGHSMTKAKFLKHGLKMVIVGEKDDVLVRCKEDGVCETYDAMVISTNGQATRDTRTLLRRFATELKLPVYIITDADPYGMHIASVIMGGSTQSAHLRGLTVPRAEWLGVWATEIPSMHPKAVLDFSERDMERCNAMTTDPRYESGVWKRELKHFIKHKKKAEIEALGASNELYLTEEYIPEKLKAAGVNV